jgi:RNA polymerase sigma-70 factor (family 1)
MNSSIDTPLIQYKIAVNRDGHAYKQLFLFFHKALIRFAFTYVKSNEAAEEVVSDIFMKIWDMGERLRDVENLKVYLFTATKNAALNYLAKYQKYTVWDLENVEVELDESVYNPEEIFLRQEFRNKVLHTVKELPPKCQMVYKLIREDGLSYKEVAQILSVSVNTVENHMTAALHKLAKALKAYIHSAQ